MLIKFIPSSLAYNSPVSCKAYRMLQCLIEVEQHPLAVWRPWKVQKPMGPRTIISTGAQTVLNFLIMQIEWWSTIHRLPDDMQMGMMRCNISENHTILYRHVHHKCWVKNNRQLLCELLAVSFQPSLPLTFKNIGVGKLYSTDFVWYW